MSGNRWCTVSSLDLCLQNHTRGNTRNGCGRRNVQHINMRPQLTTLVVRVFLSFFQPSVEIINAARHEIVSVVAVHNSVFYERLS